DFHVTGVQTCALPISHAMPTLAAHSLLQWSSMTFFCAAESLSYQPLFIVHAKVDAYSLWSLWNLVTLSMPNVMIECQGNTIASATPFSSASRASGADTCTLVAPSSDMYAAIVPFDGRIFMPLTCAGSAIACLECIVPVCTCAKQNLMSFISVGA